MALSSTMKALVIQEVRASRQATPPFSNTRRTASSPSKTAQFPLSTTTRCSSRPVRSHSTTSSGSVRRYISLSHLHPSTDAILPSLSQWSRSSAPQAQSSASTLQVRSCRSGRTSHSAKLASGSRRSCMAHIMPTVARSRSTSRRLQT